MQITRHAEKRAKERFPKHNILRSFAKALLYGIPLDELGGYAGVLVSRGERNGSKGVLYKNVVYWVKGDNVLITVTPVHQKYHKNIKKEVAKYEQRKSNRVS